MKKNIKVTILAAVAALSVSAISIVSAADTQTTNVTATNVVTQQDNGRHLGNQKAGHHFNGERSKQIFASHLAELVKDGTLTQGQADAVKEADSNFRNQQKATTQANRANLSTKTGISNTILKEIFHPQFQGKKTINGVNQNKNEVTDTNKTVKTKIGTLAKKNHKNFMNERIDSFVTNGKITQAQADALKNELKAERQANKAARETYKKDLASNVGISTETVNKIYAHPHFNHDGKAKTTQTTK